MLVHSYSLATPTLRRLPVASDFLVHKHTSSFFCLGLRDAFGRLREAPSRSSGRKYPSAGAAVVDRIYGFTLTYN